MKKKKQEKKKTVNIALVFTEVKNGSNVYCGIYRTKSPFKTFQHQFDSETISRLTQTQKPDTSRTEKKIERRPDFHWTEWRKNILNRKKPK